MISIIIPTMWKFPPFISFLADVCDHPFVLDVIIIDNNKLDRPHNDLWNHPKITIVDFGENIFVNPAWNVGALYAKGPILCFMNDDIIYDLRIFLLVINYSYNWGMIGLYYTRVDAPFKDLHLDVWRGEFPGGIGRLFFIQKQNWIDIPPGLAISYGDFFQWRMQAKKNSNLFIKNLLYWTPESQTSKFFEHFYPSDTHVWIRITQELGIPD